MTRKECAGVLAILQSEYPQSFVKLDDRQMAAKLDLWTEMFSGDDPQLVFAAVKALLTSGREFAPNIGQIKEKMHQLASPNALTETEAWALVSKACQNGLYGSKAEFDKLPPDVQAAVGSPEMLKQWAMMDADELQSVVASNFMRSYKVISRRAKEKALMPPEMRELLAGMTAKMALPVVADAHSERAEFPQNYTVKGVSR